MGANIVLFFELFNFKLMLSTLYFLALKKNIF